MKAKFTWALTAALLLALAPAGAANDPKKSAAEDKAKTAATPAAAEGMTSPTEAKTAAEPAGPSQYKTTDERFSYMMGYQIGAQVGPQIKGMAGEGKIDTDILGTGLRDAIDGKKPALSEKEIRDTMAVKKEESVKAQQEAEAAKAELEKQGPAVKAESEKFLKENAKKSGVKTTPSGLQYKVITEGKGKTPGATDFVKVNYEGKLVNGKVFDSSYKSGVPGEFQVDRVIKGWGEALQMMKEGSKWELYIPADIAYKDEAKLAPKGDVSIPPNSALIFTVELLQVLPPMPNQGMPPGHPSTGQGMPQGHPPTGKSLPPGHPPIGGGSGANNMGQ